VNDARQRDAARRAGWTGPLRGALREGGGDGQPWPPAVAEAVEALVPGARVAARPMRRSLFRYAMSGMPDTAEVVVEDDRGRFKVRYPDRPELFVEELARVVDVAVGMRRRFGAAVGHVKLVTVDYGPQGFRTSHYAGVVRPNLGTVHLNASLFLPKGLDGMEAAREQRPSRNPPQPAFGAYTRADLVTAHEFWHQVELAFEARYYRESVEFRRQLGAYFEVATLEQAVVEPGPAHDRLVAEVSAYAGTQAHEATAEMAALWWCTADDPPPVAHHFGEVVGRFFPAPPVAHP
jgi:hypothetical protein